MTLLIQEPEWDSLLEEVAGEYYKLMLIVGESGSGKTKLLKQIGGSYGFAHINLGEELSRQLSVRPIHLRSVEAEEMASKIILDTRTPKVAIDNIEILFEDPVQMDPLRFLKTQSLHKTVVATWPGRFTDHELIYSSNGMKFRLTEQDTFRILPANQT